MDTPFWLEFWAEIPGQFAYRYIPKTGQLFTRPIPVCGSIVVDFGGDLSIVKEPSGEINMTVPDTIGTFKEFVDIINNSIEWKLHMPETW